MRSVDSWGGEASATYRSLLVRLDPMDDNSSLLHVTRCLAGTFGSHVIALCVAQRIELLCDEGSAIRRPLIRDRALIEKDLERCEAEFRAALQGKSLEWRAAITYEDCAKYVATQARSADLVISRAYIDDGKMNESKQTGNGRLVIQAGRPILLVPPSAPELSLKSAIVAWKNVRESRRSIWDAVPFLKLADTVTLLAITSALDRADTEVQLNDACQWLKAHDVSAEIAAISTNSESVGYLHAELLSRRCDFLVAGAYGHTRLDEWVFGGVTQDILLKPERLTLISH
jgi:nucleotide-binding universal stress UspA family protein